MAKRKKLKYSRFADRIDLDEFYNAVGFDPIDSRADEDTGYCLDPFGLHTHGDTTGKLSFNRDKRVYNCWVCGGGSLLDFAMNVMHMDGDDATKWLYQFVDGEEAVNESKDRWRQKLYVEKGEAPPLPYFNEHVLERWEPYHPWFHERGISEETARVYKLRFNPEYIKRPPKAKAEEGEQPFHGSVIVLPHYWKGKLVGWQQRWLTDDRPKWVPKYVNTPDFPKEDTLFNYDRSINAASEIVVVESVTTVLWLESIGVPAVCTFGDSASEEQLRLLRSFQQGVIISADADKASLKWRGQLTRYLERYIPVWHTPLVGDVGTKYDLGDLAPDGADGVYGILEDAYLPLEEKTNAI